MIEILNSKLEYVWEDNKCDRTFVFIHGFNSYHQKFTHQFKDIITSHDYNYLAFNLPGHGYSQAEESEMTFKYYVDVAAELIRALGLKNLTILGHSMGGGVALALNTRLEREINTTLLVGPMTKWPKFRKEHLASLFLPKDFEDLKRLANICYFYGEHVLLDEQARVTAMKELEMFRQDTKRLGNIQALVKDLVGNENGVTEGEEMIEEGIIRSHGLHLIYGEGDKVVDQDTIREYFLTHNPKCDITVLPRCGHTPWDENRQGFLEVLESLL